MDNTKSYGAYDSPEVICYRNVANDVVCSEWFVWEGIAKEVSAEDFIQEIKNRNMNPENLGISAYSDDKGIIIDYGLRLQFWIPNTSWKDCERDVEYIKSLIKILGGYGNETK